MRWAYPTSKRTKMGTQIYLQWVGDDVREWAQGTNDISILMAPHYHV